MGRKRLSDEERYKLKMKNGKYVMNAIQRRKFKEMYPTTYNEDIARLFGVSKWTVKNLGRRMKLIKDNKAIKRLLGERLVQWDRENGVFERMKKYKPQKIYSFSDRTELVKKERLRRELGLPALSNLHLPLITYSQRQRHYRMKLKKRGYILGDYREDSGERYTVYYDSITERNLTIEAGAMRAHLRIAQFTD